MVLPRVPWGPSRHLHDDPKQERLQQEEQGSGWYQGQVLILPNMTIKEPPFYVIKMASETTQKNVVRAAWMGNETAATASEQKLQQFYSLGPEGPNGPSRARIADASKASSAKNKGLPPPPPRQGDGTTLALWKTHRLEDSAATSGQI